MKIFQKYAIQFDGSVGQMIGFPTANFGWNDGITFTWWLYFDTSSRQRLCEFYVLEPLTDSLKYNIILDYYDTQLFSFNVRAYDMWKGVGTSIPCGKWYFMVLRQNVNGVFEAIIYDTAGVIWSRKDSGYLYKYMYANAGMKFRFMTSYERSLEGKLGEFRAYNRVLTDEEISYLHKGAHLEDGLVFWLYPDDESILLDSDGETVLQITEKINGYVGTAYNSPKITTGKDVDLLKDNKKVLLIKRV